MKLLLVLTCLLMGCGSSSDSPPAVDKGYIIVQGGQTTVEDTVADKMKNGYEPVGGVSVGPGGLHSQAMRKAR